VDNAHNRSQDTKSEGKEVLMCGEAVSQDGGNQRDECPERELFAQHKNEFSFRVLPVGPL